MRKFAFLICLLGLALVLCACGGTETPPDTGVTYTVYIKDADGNALEGVLIQFCDDNNVCMLPVATDKEGKVAMNYAPANYHVSVTVVPEGFTADADGYYFCSGETEMTVTLEKTN